MRLNDQAGLDVGAQLGEVADYLLLALYLLLVLIGAVGYLLRRREEGVEETKVGARDPYCARPLERGGEYSTGGILSE